VIEVNPVAGAIAAYMEDRVAWDGTTTQLWRELQARDQTEARPTETKGWPKDPVSFGIALAKTLPTPRKIGVEATRDRLKSRKRTPMVHLRRIEQEEQRQHWAAERSERSERSEGLASNRALARIIPFPES
jgi:hypothetical protein